MKKGVIDLNLTKYDVGFWVCLLISAIVASNGEGTVDYVLGVIWAAAAFIYLILGNRKERKP